MEEEEDDFDIESNYLYLACTKISNEIYLKIGITKNIKERMRKIVTNSPLSLRVVFYTYKDCGRENKALEKILHFYLRHYHVHHEWFKPDKYFFIELENLLNKFKGKLSYEESYNLFDKIIEEVPSLENYFCEANELILHFSEIVWETLIFEWKDKKYVFKDKEILKNYTDMYSLLENLT